jgi:DAACS family dicarboxylate/amino acid:cation (Na+ or H+) symporter
LTTLFLAQCFGVDLGLGQQIIVLGLCIVGSIGTAGVPAGSLPVIAVILGYLHLCRRRASASSSASTASSTCAATALNVTGDLATADRRVEARK